MDVIETDRLVLRPARVDEAPIYHRLWTERDPRVPPHRQINAEGRPTVADIEGHLRAKREYDGMRAVERRDTADVIGYCGFPDTSVAEPELAFELLRAVHGRGYATEAGQAMVEWAREAGYARLRARVWDWNVASRRVLAKLGFRETGRVEPTSVHGHTLLTVREL